MRADTPAHVLKMLNTNTKRIPFNWPYMTGKELYHIAEAHFNGSLAGDGPFTKRCHAWLEARMQCNKALLTHSCTAALEMAALLVDIQPGDEVIMPSYTFVSTANAFVARGGVPVFVDIREDTLNLDEKLLESAITDRTRAIVPVHYAGVACEMNAIMETAHKHDLWVIEDAAQGVMASYQGRALGSIGHLGTYSFHETKNLHSGEGGALLVNHRDFDLQAEVIREKGTDRSRFFRGEVDKYTWQSLGSSFLPGELVAAFLWAQFEEADTITQARLDLWARYHAMLEPLEAKGVLRRPVAPEGCVHNAHMYYVLFDSEGVRNAVLAELRSREIHAVFHYIPLHTSPGGVRYGRAHGELSVTTQQAGRLLRLPMWVGLTEDQQTQVVNTLRDALGLA